MEDFPLGLLERENALNGRVFIGLALSLKRYF
jgi:hypothetical protein